MVFFQPEKIRVTDGMWQEVPRCALTLPDYPLRRKSACMAKAFNPPWQSDAAQANQAVGKCDGLWLNAARLTQI